MIAIFDPTFAASVGEASAVTAIVLARLLIPLLIPRVPLVIIVALVIDSADQDLLKLFTEVDTSANGPYQNWDKALDIWYLSIAYLAALRNWTSDSAFRIAQFLLYYRLLGAALFELSGARAMLLLFPNTFEYFFILYEIVRLRREPSRFSARFWLLAAAGLWVFVKLPQEYWIHVAKLAFTDTFNDYPAFAVAVVAGLLLAALVLIFVVLPRLPAADWGWRFATDRLPSSLVGAHARFARRLESGRVLTREAFEEVLLLSLLGVIFASILPSVNATPLQVAVGVTAIVLANAAISLEAARRGRFRVESAAAEYAALLPTNLVLVYVAI
ncbi:MAG TPA: hypothetical protein VE270_04030, partial [Thermoleophilaceae bacterium]|nr:hypothetical protein [Thermoleophilaceae bacterium]